MEKYMSKKEVRFCFRFSLFSFPQVVKPSKVVLPTVPLSTCHWRQVCKSQERLNFPPSCRLIRSWQYQMPEPGQKSLSIYFFETTDEKIVHNNGDKPYCHNYPKSNRIKSQMRSKMVSIHDCTLVYHLEDIIYQCKQCSLSTIFRAKPRWIQSRKSEDSRCHHSRLVHKLPYSFP